MHSYENNRVSKKICDFISKCKRCGEFSKFTKHEMHWEFVSEDKCVGRCKVCKHIFEEQHKWEHREDEDGYGYSSVTFCENCGHIKDQWACQKQP